MKGSTLFSRVCRFVPSRRALVVIGMALAMHLSAACAWAQKRGRLADDEDSLLRWGITAGIVVVIGLTAFLNSKRSHLT